MRNLAADVAAVIDRLGAGAAILIGHDWGAPIVWNTALLYPEKVAAVAGLSVPYVPRGQASFITLARSIYAGRFFYQLYFQEEGVAEAEFESDIPAALRKLYFAASGDAPLDALLAMKPADAKLLDGMADPQPFPAWMSQADLKAYADAFKAGGFRGPLNRYRAQEIDFIDFAGYAGKPVTPPSFFIAGERDPVRRFIPGLRPLSGRGGGLLRLPRLRDRAARRALGAAGGPGGDQRGPGRLPRADLAGLLIGPRGSESHSPDPSGVYSPKPAKIFIWNDRRRPIDSPLCARCWACPNRLAARRQALPRLRTL